MTIIKRIIEWIINLFRRLFGLNKKDNTHRILMPFNKNSAKQKEIKFSSHDTMPSYMIISDNNKEKLLYALAIMKNFLEENNKQTLEKELLDTLKKYQKINLDYLDEENLFLNYNHLDTIIKDLDLDDKKVIIDQFQVLEKRNNDFKVHLEEVDKIIDLINKKDISLIVENAIDREVTNIISDKNLDKNTEEKIDNFNKNVYDILDHVDEDTLNRVIREYKKVNYVTLSTVIIDKNYERFKKLEDDYKNHRYNKYYYEREINRIKRELNKVKNLKNSKDINNHINSLKKELYTKSKDKYDLLYNNEVFTNALKECDMLLDKINAKVVDIKKEEKEEKKEEDNLERKKKEYIENILARFHDMDLARSLIFKAQEEDLILSNQADLENFVNNIYNRFNMGINDNFEFLRNKTKTEYIILYNGLNKVISDATKENYISVDHINFKMEDLIEATGVKVQEVSEIMKKKNIMIDDTLIKEKIGLINDDIHKNNPLVLKKNIKKNNVRKND